MGLLRVPNCKDWVLRLERDDIGVTGILGIAKNIDWDTVRLGLE